MGDCSFLCNLSLSQSAVPLPMSILSSGFFFILYASTLKTLSASAAPSSLCRTCEHHEQSQLQLSAVAQEATGKLLPKTSKLTSYTPVHMPSAYLSVSLLPRPSIPRLSEASELAASPEQPMKLVKPVSYSTPYLTHVSAVLCHVALSLERPMC